MSDIDLHKSEDVNVIRLRVSDQTNYYLVVDKNSVPETPYSFRIFECQFHDSSNVSLFPLVKTCVCLSTTLHQFQCQSLLPPDKPKDTLGLVKLNETKSRDT